MSQGGGGNDKRERKTEENYMKNGGKDLKNASFRAINKQKYLLGISNGG